MSGEKKINISGISILFVLTAVISILSAGTIYIQNYVKTKSCTEPVTARITEYVETQHKSRIGTRRKTVKSEVPEFEYMYDGEFITSKLDHVLNRNDYPVGSYVDICIDPDKPTKFYVQGNTYNQGLCIVFFIVGAVSCVIAVGAELHWRFTGKGRAESLEG